MKTRPVSYLQTDPRWANLPYAVKGESATIGRSGCGPTSMAMVLATWVSPTITPASECAWALAHGYKAKGRGTFYGYFVPAAARYGLTCRQMNSASIYGNGDSIHHATVKAALDRGDSLAIACMGPGVWTSGGHFVLVYRIDGNTVYINDPASTRPARTMGDYRVFRRQVKYYWIIKGPKEKEVPDVTTEEVKRMVETAIAQATPQIVLAALEAMPRPVVYKRIEDVPAWGRAAVQKRIDEGVLEGSGSGLWIGQDLLQAWVVQDREAEIARDVGDLQS